MLKISLHTSCKKTYHGALKGWRKILQNVKLTALKGGDWPAGKLIVLKLMRSKSEDILWKGP